MLSLKKNNEGIFCKWRKTISKIYFYIFNVKDCTRCHLCLKIKVTLKKYMYVL